MYEKRQILLDRNSLIEHLKKNGYNGDLLLGMSDKKLFELYSMEENDLVNYHASDATKDEYYIGLGDDIELGETINQTRSTNAKEALGMLQQIDPDDPQGPQTTVTGDMDVVDKTTGVKKKIPGNQKNIESGSFQEIDPEISDVAGSISVTQTMNEPTAESRRYDKKTLEEKFSKLAKLKEQRKLKHSDDNPGGAGESGPTTGNELDFKKCNKSCKAEWTKRVGELLYQQSGRFFISQTGKGFLRQCYDRCQKQFPTSESLEADKNLVMEMINKQSRPTATKSKIMEYILKNSK